MHTFKYSVPKYIFLLLTQNKNLAISYINLFTSTFRIKTMQDHDCYCSLRTTPVLTETSPPHTPRGLCGPHTWSDRAHPLTEVSGRDTRGWGQGVCPHVGNGRSGRLPPLPGPLPFRRRCWRTCVFCLCPGFSRLRYVGHASYWVSVNLSIISAHRDQTQINGNTEEFCKQLAITSIFYFTTLRVSPLAQ